MSEDTARRDIPKPLHVSAVWRLVVVGAALRLDVSPFVDLSFKLFGVELFEACAHVG